VLRYYWGLLRGIPSTFRGTVEAWIFWAGGVMLPILAILFHVFGRPFRLPDIPPGYALGLLGLAFIYAVARVNYDRFAVLEGEVKALRGSRVSREVIQKLVELRAMGVALKFKSVQYQIGYENWVTELEAWNDKVSTHLCTPGFPVGSRHEFNYPDISPPPPGSEFRGFNEGHAARVIVLSRQLEILTKIIERSSAELV
jgi:hypothetical protein